MEEALGLSRRTEKCESKKDTHVDDDPQEDPEIEEKLMEQMLSVVKKQIQGKGRRN